MQLYEKGLTDDMFTEKPQTVPVHESVTRNHKIFYFEISVEKFLIWFICNILFIWKLKKIMMLCGEVQNVQTPHTKYTFAQWEITLVL